MARDAPVAAVLRRGPTDWYQVIRWQTRRDEFTEGSWFRGRIYERRCDVSPNGELFLYFSFKGSRAGTEYKRSWTAVSRLPWLHALALWPWGHTWGGGGEFLTNRKVALGTDLPPEPHPDHPPDGLEVVYDQGAERHESAGLVEGADWSGHDHEGHLVYCRDGKLFRRHDVRDVELADFDEREPDPRPPPERAKEPLT